MTGAAVGPATLNFLEHREVSAKIHIGATVFFWTQYRQLTGVGQCLYKLDRVSLFPILFAPILIRIIGTQACNRGTNVVMSSIIFHLHSIKPSSSSPRKANGPTYAARWLGPAGMASSKPSLHGGPMRRNDSQVRE